MEQDLYGMLFEENKEFGVLLGVLGLTKKQIGRYRDIFVTEDKQKIILFTRLGSTAQEEYAENIKFLRNHKNYLRDYPDDFDDTYVYYEFSIPEERKLICESMGGQKILSVTEKVDREIELLESGDEKAMERAKKVMEGVAFAVAENLFLQGLALEEEEKKED